MSPEQLAALEKLTASTKGAIDIQFSDYNWMLNVLDSEGPEEEEEEEAEAQASPKSTA